MPYLQVNHDGEEINVHYIHDHRMAEVTKVILRTCNDDEIATMANTALKMFLKRGEG
jgi:hypothetical protein